MHHLLAGVVIGGSVVFAEIHFGWFGHGAHLMLVLLLVTATALLLGPRPATTALLVGGFGSAAASVAAMGSPDPIPAAIAQLAFYLVAGLLGIGLLTVILGMLRRGRPPAGAQPARPLVEPLTEREQEVLRLAAAGMSTRDIGAAVFLSPNTVKSHLSHAYSKLGARNRSDAVRAALHCGCLVASDICPHQPVEATNHVAGEPNHPKG